MITSIFFYVFAWILNRFAYLFSLLNFALPDSVSTSLNYMLGYFGYLKGVFPVDTLFTVAGIGLTFLLLLYTVKLLLWAYSLIPFIGRHVGLPSLEQDDLGRTHGERMQERRLRSRSFWRNKNKL